METEPGISSEKWSFELIEETVHAQGFEIPIEAFRRFVTTGELPQNVLLIPPVISPGLGFARGFSFTNNLHKCEFVVSFGWVEWNSNGGQIIQAPRTDKNVLMRALELGTNPLGSVVFNPATGEEKPIFNTSPLGAYSPESLAKKVTLTKLAFERLSNLHVISLPKVVSSAKLATPGGIIGALLYIREPIIYPHELINLNYQVYKQYIIQMYGAMRLMIEKAKVMHGQLHGTNKGYALMRESPAPYIGDWASFIDLKEYDDTEGNIIIWSEPHNNGRVTTSPLKETMRLATASNIPFKKGTLLLTDRQTVIERYLAMAIMTDLMLAFDFGKKNPLETLELIIEGYLGKEITSTKQRIELLSQIICMVTSRTILDIEELVVGTTDIETVCTNLASLTSLLLLKETQPVRIFVGFKDGGMDFVPNNVMRASNHKRFRR